MCTENVAVRVWLRLITPHLYCLWGAKHNSFITYRHFCTRPLAVGGLVVRFRRLPRSCSFRQKVSTNFGTRAAGRSRRFSASGKAARARVCRAERIYALASVCLTWRTGEFPSRFLAAEPGYGRHFFRAEKSAPVRGLFLGRNNRGEAAYTTSPRKLFSGAALACGVGSCVDGCPITPLIATTLQGGGDHASACARNEQASHANRECLIARLR